MLANNVCKMSRTPFSVYRAVYQFRLQHGLECLDGPLSLEDLKCERVMKAVYSAIISVTDEVMVRDECHFGMIDNPRFFAMALICQQKNFPLDIIGKFQVSDDYVVTCDACVDSFSSVISVVKVNDDQVDVTDDIEFINDEPGFMFPVNMPFPDRPVVGFDVKYTPYTVPEVKEDSVDHVSVIQVNPDTLCTYVQMPLERYVPVANLSYSILEGSYELEVDNGVFLVRDDATGEYENKTKIIGEELEEYIPFVVKAQTEDVSVRLKLSYAVEVDGYYSTDPTMKLFAMRFSNKCRKLFDIFISQLKKLPRTQLVMHNLHVLQHVIYGWRMPSKELINQVALMTGNDWACSQGYSRLFEKWRFYRRYESWHHVFQTRFKRGYVFRSPLSLFDGHNFKYRGVLHNDVEEKLLRFEHSKKYDGSMSYVNYLDFCKRQRDITDVNSSISIKYKQMLYNEICEDNDINMRRIPLGTSSSDDDNVTHSCADLVSRHSSADLYNEHLYEPDVSYGRRADTSDNDEVSYNSDEIWDEEMDRRSQIWDSSLVDY